MMKGSCYGCPLFFYGDFEQFAIDGVYVGESTFFGIRNECRCCKVCFCNR